MAELLMTYFADDLTGATDALEVLSKAGARTLLFIDPPTPDVLDRYPDLDALGIAGRTRSLSPEAMEAELSVAFAALLKLQSRHLHYKVCSTFDSSPTRGSIGRAIDVGRRVIGSKYVPLLVAAPSLGRYCIFGHLYAAAGIGGDGQIYRLDRHPSASKHPSTPMRESDLRVHLGEQTDAAIASFDLLNLNLPMPEQIQELTRLINGGADVVLFDSLTDQHLLQVGAMLDEVESTGYSNFCVGSSGIESALGLHWQQTGRLSAHKQWEVPVPTDQVLVVSGSCSPVTQAQIEWAKQAGFAEVALDTLNLAGAEFSADVIRQPIKQVMEQLNSGKSVVMHTSLGTADPRVTSTQKLLNAADESDSVKEYRCAHLLGLGLGRIVRRVLDESALQRICIAGGDTASFVGREIGIEALEMASPLTVGAPLCKIHAPNSPSDGLEVVFKGGQVGGKDFFGTLLTGTAA